MDDRDNMGSGAAFREFAIWRKTFALRVIQRGLSGLARRLAPLKFE